MHTEIDAILDELRRAVAKFPTWPTDPLHALAVLGEEFGETTKAVLQAVYEPHKSTPADVRAEAIQTAAMAIRFLISLDAYRWAPGPQHHQAALQVEHGATRKKVEPIVFSFSSVEEDREREIADVADSVGAWFIDERDVAGRAAMAARVAAAIRGRIDDPDARNCPTCRGSGHVDDAPSLPLTRAVYELNAVLGSLFPRDQATAIRVADAVMPLIIAVAGPASPPIAREIETAHELWDMGMRADGDRPGVVQYPARFDITVRGPKRVTPEKETAVSLVVWAYMRGAIFGIGDVRKREGHYRHDNAAPYVGAMPPATEGTTTVPTFSGPDEVLKCTRCGALGHFVCGGADCPRRQPETVPRDPMDPAYGDVYARDPYRKPAKLCENCAPAGQCLKRQAICDFTPRADAAP